MSVGAGVWTCPTCGETFRGDHLIDPGMLAEFQRSHGKRCRPRPPRRKPPRASS